MGPISYCFADKWQYLLNFPTPVHLTPQPSNFATAVWLKKQNDAPYQTVKKDDDMFIHLDIVPALDRQTDRIGKTILRFACIAC